MRLGLNDVLYDNKAKTVYTPNMNALANLNGAGSQEPGRNDGKE